MDKQTFTSDQLAEIYFALGDRVNQLIKSKGWIQVLPNDVRSGRYSRLVDRQLERTNQALAIVEKLLAN